MSRRIAFGFAALALALSTPALAKDGHGAPEPTHQAGGHADSHAATPSDEAHGEGDGEHHGGHHYYTADDDGDGVPNWRDAMNGEEPNELYVVTDLAFHAFNLGLLVVLILVFVRRPVRDALRTRALNIRKELTDSAKERDEAKQGHDEIAARLAAIETEIEAMHVEAKNDAAVEEAKLIERAHAEGERIAAGTERKIRDEAQRARLALRNDAVALAVELAEGALRESVSADDQQRLARDFLTAINEDGASPDA